MSQATLSKLLEQIKELDPVEREELVFALLDEIPLIIPSILRWRSRHYVPEYPSIVATPGVCGGAARLIRTRIPIWTLERMRQLGVSEIDILRSFPSLRAVDLVQAWSYVARNRDEIEKSIRENEEE
jgi:uncharacterized protein (DUF433 family)